MINLIYRMFALQSYPEGWNWIMHTCVQLAASSAIYRDVRPIFKVLLELGRKSGNLGIESARLIIAVYRITATLFHRKPWTANVIFWRKSFPLRASYKQCRVWNAQRRVETGAIAELRYLFSPFDEISRNCKLSDLILGKAPGSSLKIREVSKKAIL